MQRQRPLNSSVPMDPPNIARDGAAKHTVTAPVKPGMVRQTQGEPAAYHHGVSVDDTPNTGIIKSHQKPIGFNHSVSDKQIIEFSRSATSDQILDEAHRLGQPPEKA
jgi:hypothetical protein